MRTLVFFLEEPSARAFLESILPRLQKEIPAFHPRYFVYNGKNDLRENITRDLRQYKNRNDVRLIVLQDQDMNDCLRLKLELADLCHSAGVPAVVRIACRELESWYLAQLDMVEKAFGIKGLARQQSKQKYRNPDFLATPDRILKEITQHRYSKIAGSKILGELLDPENTRSPSYRVFMTALRQALSV